MIARDVNLVNGYIGKFITKSIVGNKNVINIKIACDIVVEYFVIPFLMKNTCAKKFYFEYENFNEWGDSDYIYSERLSIFKELRKRKFFIEESVRTDIDIDEDDPPGFYISDGFYISGWSIYEDDEDYDNENDEDFWIKVFNNPRQIKNKE